MRRAHAGQAPGNDLPCFGNETGKQANVLVVDRVNLLDAELANLLAAEELPSAFPRATWSCARPSCRTRSTRTTAAALVSPLARCGRAAFCAWARSVARSYATLGSR